MKKSIKNLNWIKLLLIFSAIGIVIGSLFRILTPQEHTPTLPETQTALVNPDGTKSEFQNITFEGTHLAPEQELGVYQAILSEAKTKTALNAAIERLASHHQLKEIYTDTTSSIHTGELYTLLIDFTSNEINFSKDSLETTVIPGLEASLEKAANFLYFVLPETNFRPIPQQVKYYGGELHLVPLPKQEASIVEIPFSVLVDQLPVFYHQEIDAFARVFVDGNGQVQKAVIRPISLEYELATSFTPITIEEALVGINQKNIGSIIRTAADNPTPVSLEEIKNGILKSTNLEYRIDPALNLIYPCYRFEGNFIDKNNQKFEGVLITPAIAIEDRN